mmetsp:Transcript_5699/g.9816  ORF Transcript_5699/g.9816 Transcript_5699/m.9816 type:complete len:219 (-) Transcript_5699:97-753(-)
MLSLFCCCNEASDLRREQRRQDMMEPSLPAMVDVFNQNGLVLPVHSAVTRSHDAEKHGAQSWQKSEPMREEKPPVVLPVPAVEANTAPQATYGQKLHSENSSKLVNETPEVTGNGESRPDSSGPDEFRVQFSTQGKKMGAEIAHGVGRNVGTVRIKSIRPGGLIHDWNMQNPDHQVTENCFIVELNGRQIAEMQREDIRTEFRHAKEVNMLLKRAALQ